MSEKHKKEVQKILEREKIRVLLYPVAVASILYGLQLSLFPAILENYRVYSLISAFVSHWEVGSIFIILPILMVIMFILNNRTLLLITATILLMIWSMFAVAFVLSPPPNTVWIFAAVMTYMTFSLARRV